MITSFRSRAEYELYRDYPAIYWLFKELKVEIVD